MYFVPRCTADASNSFAGRSVGWWSLKRLVCLLFLASCTAKQERVPNCKAYRITDYVVEAESVGEGPIVSTPWHGGALSTRPTQWETLTVRRAHPFPGTTSSPFPSAFSATDITPFTEIREREILFVRFAGPDEGDAGFVIAMNQSYFSNQDGGWIAHYDSPALSDAQMQTELDELDQRPECGRDVTECVTGNAASTCYVDGGTFSLP